VNAVVTILVDGLTYASWLVPAWLGLMAVGVIVALVSRTLSSEAAASS